MLDSLGDGYVRDIGDELQVIANNPTTMGVAIKTGRAYIQGYSVDIEDSVYPLTIDAADATNPRIDRIVLKLSTTVDRNISAVVLKGTPSSGPAAPALTRTTEYWEISLAQIYVGAGVTSIATANITDERRDNDVCGAAGVKHRWMDAANLVCVVVDAGDVDDGVSDKDSVRFDGTKWISDPSADANGIYDEINSSVVTQGVVSGYTGLYPGTHPNKISTAISDTEVVVYGKAGGMNIYTVRTWKNKSATSGTGVKEAYCTNPNVDISTVAARDAIFKSFTRHCLIKRNWGGKIYVKEDNWAQDLEGNAVSLTGSDGDFMLEVDPVWWTTVDHTDYYDEIFALTPFQSDVITAHMWDGHVKKHIYCSVAPGTVDDGTLTSRVVASPGAASLNNEQFYNYARARGSGAAVNTYTTQTGIVDTLMNILHDFVYLTKNMQGDVAQGYCDGAGSMTKAISDDVSVTGGNTQGSTSVNTMNCVTCGLINYYAYLWRFKNESIQNGSKLKMAVDNADHYNITTGSYAGAPETWVELDLGVPVGAANSFITAISGNKYWPQAPTAVGSSSTTYFCDAFYSDAGDHCCIVGGGVYCGASDGLFCAAVSTAVGYACWDLGARLLIVDPENL